MIMAGYGCGLSSGLFSLWFWRAVADRTWDREVGAEAGWEVAGGSGRASGAWGAGGGGGGEGGGGWGRSSGAWVAAEDGVAEAGAVVVDGAVVGADLVDLAEGRAAV